MLAPFKMIRLFKKLHFIEEDFFCRNSTVRIYRQKCYNYNNVLNVDLTYQKTLENTYFLNSTNDHVIKVIKGNTFDC